jgi:hypothetical protein
LWSYRLALFARCEEAGKSDGCDNFFHTLCFNFFESNDCLLNRFRTVCTFWWGLLKNRTKGLLAASLYSKVFLLRMVTRSGIERQSIDYKVVWLMGALIEVERINNSALNQLVYKLSGFTVYGLPNRLTLQFFCKNKACEHQHHPHHKRHCKLNTV